MEIIINEAKQVGVAGNIKLNAGNPATGLPAQMSNAWLTKVLNDMDNITSLQSLAAVIRQNFNKVKKTVTAVDKSTSEIVILRLSNY